MDEITPLNKMFDNAQSRVRMDQIRQQMAKQPAHKSGQTDSGAETRRSADTADTARNQGAQEKSRAEENLPAPTYTEVEKTQRKKPGPLYSREGRCSHFQNITSDDTYARLIEDEERMKQLCRGVKEKVAVMFADIRSFTYISSTMPPDRVFTMLNIFLNEMVALVRDENGGYIDKIIGDCIMAYFGLPYPTECSMRAVATAVDMQNRLERVNQRLGERGFPDISVGIGLNTGEVRAGFVTTDRNVSGFTIIGDTVNLAAKYESIAGPGEIVVGPLTASEIAGAFRLEEHHLKVRITGQDGEFKEHSCYRVLWE